MLSWDEFNQNEASAVPARGVNTNQIAVENGSALSEAAGRDAALQHTAIPAAAPTQAAACETTTGGVDGNNNANALRQAIQDLKSLDVSAGLEELEE